MGKLAKMIATGLEIGVPQNERVILPALGALWGLMRHGSR